MNSQESLNDLLFTHKTILKFEGIEKIDTLSKIHITSYKIGVETYYFKNGKLAKKQFINKNTTKIIDLFNFSGDHLIINGNGFEYKIESGYSPFEHRDSLVYEVKNSVRLGTFNRYRRYINTTYYLMESGTIKNGVEDGKWILNEYKLGNFSEKNYLNGNLNGFYSLRRNKINRIEKGYYNNNLKDGLWTIADTNDNIIEMVPYYKDYKKGLYIKYFPNGKIEERGIYNQDKGIFESSLVNFETGAIEKIKVKVNNLEVKNGIWEYYDEKGNIIKTEIYNNGVLIK